MTNDRNPTEEEAKAILTRLRAERIYHWIQLLWLAVHIEAVLVAVLLLI